MKTPLLAGRLSNADDPSNEDEDVLAEKRVVDAVERGTLPRMEWGCGGFLQCALLCPPSADTYAW